MTVGKRFTASGKGNILCGYPPCEKGKECRIPDKLTFIYTDIGRGHPFYLDGLMEALIKRKELGLVKG